MNDFHGPANIPLTFVAAACFAYAGWYYLLNTRKACEMIAAKGWPRFLAKASSGKAAYCTYQAIGGFCFLVALCLLGIAALSFVNRGISN